MTHSPEPWNAGKLGGVQPVVMHPTSEGGFMEVARVLRNEDANRIVACVNACAGIETETLTSMTLKTLPAD